jgi:hypothetical protein
MPQIQLAGDPRCDQAQGSPRMARAIRETGQEVGEYLTAYRAVRPPRCAASYGSAIAMAPEVDLRSAENPAQTPSSASDNGPVGVRPP